LQGNPETSTVTREIRESDTSSQGGRHRETETSKERHPESRTQLSQLCNPTAMMVSNSRLRDKIGRRLKGHIWEEARKQLESK